jgi:hypothetical protein
MIRQRFRLYIQKNNRLILLDHNKINLVLIFMHYNQLITGKNKKISYKFFMDYLLSIEEKVKKHPYPNPNRYPNFFSSFD